MESSENVEPFLNHISILVNHYTDHFDYFIKWLAQLVQQPGKLTGIAVVLISKEGAGKNVFLDSIANILGREYYFETASPETHLFGRFSNGRVNKLLIDIDEAKGRDTFSHSDELKNMITSTVFNYEQKGVDAVELHNFARLIFTTNNDLCIKIEANTRRYVIFEASSEKIGNKEYFKEYVEYMTDVKNQKAIINYLRNINISGVNWIQDRPLSDAYLTIQQQCADLPIKYLEYLYFKHKKSNEFVYTGSELFSEFIFFITTKLKLREDRSNSWNVTRFGLKIRKLCDEFPNAITKKNNNGHRVVKCYAFNTEHLEAMLRKFGMLSEDSYMFLEDDI